MLGFFVSKTVHVSSNGSTLPTVPIIGTGKYIQLGDQTTETNITPQETTRPYNSTYSTRNKSSTNLRGDYHSKLAACRVPGQRPLRPHPLRLSNRLNFFPVPDYLRAYVKEERMDEIVITEPSLGEVHNTKYIIMVFGHLQIPTRAHTSIAFVHGELPGLFFNSAIPGGDTERD